jgi:SAM-dependent methyltransferase
MTGSSTFLAADGDGYELQMGRWSRRLAGPFLEFVGTAHGECVLDVGRGTGRLAFALTERCQVKELRGIDFSPAYIAYATRHNHDPRLVFQVGDACALDFPDHCFDRVLSLLIWKGFAKVNVIGGTICIIAGLSTPLLARVIHLSLRAIHKSLKREHTDTLNQ